MNETKKLCAELTKLKSLSDYVVINKIVDENELKLIKAQVNTIHHSFNGNNITIVYPTGFYKDGFCYIDSYAKKVKVCRDIARIIKQDPEKNKITDFADLNQFDVDLVVKFLFEKNKKNIYSRVFELIQKNQGITASVIQNRIKNSGKAEVEEILERLELEDRITKKQHKGVRGKSTVKYFTV